jgi:GNAT superfamily N-acetyltransferase
VSARPPAGAPAIRSPRAADAEALRALPASVVGPERAGPFVASHFERHHLLVAEAAGGVVGLIGYRTDWFQCTLVADAGHRARGIARALYRAVETMSPGPRLFSSTEETNAVGIKTHTALGFQPSGHIDNLPQGYRELLFYKRLGP